MAIAAALALALMRDSTVASCARQAGGTPQAYVAHAFGLRGVTLRTGERMTVAEATDPCLLLGQSTRIFVFRRTGAGYGRVLESVAIPGDALVSGDGTAITQGTTPENDPGSSIGLKYQIEY